MQNINIKRIDAGVPIPVGNPFKVSFRNNLVSEGYLCQVQTGLYFDDFDEEKYAFEAESVVSKNGFWVIKAKLIENKLVLLLSSPSFYGEFKEGDIIASVSIVEKKELEKVRFIEKNKSGGRVIAGDAVSVEKEEE